MLMAPSLDLGPGPGVEPDNPTSLAQKLNNSHVNTDREEDHEGSAIPGWEVSVLDRIIHLRGPPANAGQVRDYYYQELYNQPLDFQHLSRRCPQMRAQMDQHGEYLDLQNPANLSLLTKALLDQHFGGLQLELPPDRLCPPVPNRHLYILWLKDLLDSTGPLINEQCLATTERKLVGIDIGTGASAIYPILGCTERPWNFIATELDEKSCNYAQKNLARNNLLDRVRLVCRPRPYHEDAALLLPLDELAVDRVDFVMTNPPFYESETDMWKRSADKKLPPRSVNTGGPSELICKDGEVGFVKQMIKESTNLRSRVQWYTAMLSSPQSVERLLVELKGLGITNTAATTFVTGGVTRRYALAWTFTSRRPSRKAARGQDDATTSKIPRSLLPTETEHTIPLGPHHRQEELVIRVGQHMASLNLRSWEWSHATLKGSGFTNEAVWTRSYRRKLELAARGTNTHGTSLVDGTAGGDESGSKKRSISTSENLLSPSPRPTKRGREPKVASPSSNLSETKKALDEADSPIRQSTEITAQPLCNASSIEESLQFGHDHPVLKDHYSFGFTLEIERDMLTVVVQGEKDATTQSIWDSQLRIRWLKGDDPVMFESFCGSLNRALADRNGPLARPIVEARRQLENVPRKRVKHRGIAEEEPMPVDPNLDK